MQASSEWFGKRAKLQAYLGRQAVDDPLVDERVFRPTRVKELAIGTEVGHAAAAVETARAVHVRVHGHSIAHLTLLHRRPDGGNDPGVLVAHQARQPVTGR